MARNGSGTFSLLVNSWNPAVATTSATTADWQALINDVASAITGSVAADGQTTMTGNLNINSNRITNLAAANASGHALVFGQSSWSLAAGTISGALTLSGAVAASGGATISAAAWNFPDTFLQITGSSDATKIVRFEVDGLTTGTTRTATIQDRDGVIAYVSDLGGYLGLSASVAGNALTATLASGSRLNFSVAGVNTAVTTAGALTVTASSGSTLGTSNAVRSRIWVVALYNGGTPELALINPVSGTNVLALNVAETISTTAEGGAGAADSPQVFYSTTARSNQAFVVVGYIESTQATAGTWATSPSKTQGFGAGIPLPGTVLQELYVESAGSSTASTTAVDVTSASVAITPANSVNLLQCQVTCGVSVPNTASFNSGAYLSLTDSSNTALDGETLHAAFSGGGNSGWQGQSAFMKRIAPASASAYTFKLRHRASGAGAGETITTSRVKLHAREISV